MSGWERHHSAGMVSCSAPRRSGNAAGWNVKWARPSKISRGKAPQVQRGQQRRRVDAPVRPEDEFLQPRRGHRGEGLRHHIDHGSQQRFNQGCVKEGRQTPRMRAAGAERDEAAATQAAASAPPARPRACTHVPTVCAAWMACHAVLSAGWGGTCAHADVREGFWLAWKTHAGDASHARPKARRGERTAAAARASTRRTRSPRPRRPPGRDGGVPVCWVAWIWELLRRGTRGFLTMQVQRR